MPERRLCAGQKSGEFLELHGEVQEAAQNRRTGMKIEIYRRPKENPFFTLEDKDIRINYNDKWIDFRNGEIWISYIDETLGLIKHVVEV